jgi:hypothetical protein
MLSVQQTNFTCTYRPTELPRGGSHKIALRTFRFDYSCSHKLREVFVGQNWAALWWWQRLATICCTKNWDQSLSTWTGHGSCLLKCSVPEPHNATQCRSALHRRTYHHINQNLVAIACNYDTTYLVFLLLRNSNLILSPDHWQQWTPRPLLWHYINKCCWDPRETALSLKNSNELETRRCLCVSIFTSERK